MSTVNRSIPNAVRTANQETNSASASAPGNASAINVVLTSPDWSNPALAGKRVLWGVALSNDGGVTWGPGTCDNSDSNPIGGASTSVPAWIYKTSVIGQFGRGGGMPSFTFSGGQVIQAGGASVRLFCWPEADISLGASITVTF